MILVWLLLYSLTDVLLLCTYIELLEVINPKALSINNKYCKRPKHNRVRYPAHTRFPWKNNIYAKGLADCRLFVLWTAKDYMNYNWRIHYSFAYLYSELRSACLLQNLRRFSHDVHASLKRNWSKVQLTTLVDQRKLGHNRFFFCLTCVLNSIIHHFLLGF